MQGDVRRTMQGGERDAKSRVKGICQNEGEIQIKEKRGREKGAVVNLATQIGNTGRWSNL